jgi:hypothetical protein
MKDQRDPRQAMRPGMLADPAGRQVRCLLGHGPRLASPELTRHFIHVAVIARQVAPAVDLDDELTERKKLRRCSTRYGVVTRSAAGC